MYAKEKGEIAELEFMLEATRRGFIVSSPFGDSCEYDFIVAYVDDISAWYVLPRDIIKANNSISLYPHRDSQGTYEKFRYCWNLLMG